jgi:hypothetical protein
MKPTGRNKTPLIAQIEELAEQGQEQLKTAAYHSGKRIGGWMEDGHDLTEQFTATARERPIQTGLMLLGAGLVLGLLLGRR